MKKYKSPVMRHIHQEAASLYKHGIINAAEMREFDKDCLVKPEIAGNSTGGKSPMVAAPSASGRSVK
jgi:putative transcriptional regulator